MDIYTAIEVAYKNGYKKGADNIKEKILNNLREKFGELAATDSDGNFCVSLDEINEVLNKYGK